MTNRLVRFEYTNSAGRISQSVATVDARNIRRDLERLRDMHIGDPQFKLRPGKNFEESVWFYQNMPSKSPWVVSAASKSNIRGQSKAAKKKPPTKLSWEIQPPSDIG